MKAYFHKSFTFKRDNISNLISFVRQHPSASRQEIAVETGIGIGKNVSDGKVRATIQYAIYSGLLRPDAADTKKEIGLSGVGEVVLHYDPRLKSSVSQWVMHYFLCRPQNEALIWSFFIHDFLPAHDAFDSATLEEELSKRFPTLSPRINKENRRILTTCYTDLNALAKTGLLETYKKDEYIRGNPKHTNPYLAAYLLAEIWEAKHGPDVMMVDPAVLLEKGDLATTMNLNEGDLRNCIDDVTSISAVRQMREAPPFKVVRRWESKLSLLRRAYEES